MSHFTIECRKCGKVLENAYCGFCEHCADALMFTRYREAEFRAGGGTEVWKFNWLPVHRAGFSQPSPVVYRSEGLARDLALEELYIAFCGYWPERGALLQTCTFKEFEAAVVIENAMENGTAGLVVASAGNTARAFTHLSTVSRFRAAIVVPTMCLGEMWNLEERPSAPTIALSDGDYADAIACAKRMAVLLEMPFEGGVKNIAKRDGLGIVLMEAAAVMKKLPDHYFQAVGSGAGAIAVWEMSERFLGDGRFGDRLPELHLAQNLPFAPMSRAWWRNSRELSETDLDPALIGEITTMVLSTRYPAYGIRGGVFDALQATGGEMYGVTNDEVYRAMDIFEATEGIDIVPAAGVAVAALRQAVERKKIHPGQTVLLNVSGGGERRLLKDRPVYRVNPVVISKKMADKEMEELLCSLKTG